MTKTESDNPVEDQGDNEGGDADEAGVKRAGEGRDYGE